MPLPVHQDRTDTEQREEHDEVVEKCHAAHHDGVAVNGEQKSGDHRQ